MKACEEMKPATPRRLKARCRLDSTPLPEHSILHQAVIPARSTTPVLLEKALMSPTSKCSPSGALLHPFGDHRRDAKPLGLIQSIPKRAVRSPSGTAF